MVLVSFWVRYPGDGAEEVYFFDAIDEYGIDSNPGWIVEKRKELAGLLDRGAIDAFREINLGLWHSEIVQAFKTPNVSCDVKAPG